MNVKSTLIASALVSTLVAAACGTETSSPVGTSGNVPPQSAANYEEGLVVGAHQAAAKIGHHSDGGGSHAQTGTHCQMSSDALEQWVTNGVVPRCHLLAHRQSGKDDHRK